MQMISITKSFYGKLFAAVLVLAASSGLAHASSSVCMNTGNGNGGSIAYYPYLFNNNTFGWNTDKSGSSECFTLNYTNGANNGVYYDGFGATWNWPEANDNTKYDVKAYPSMVYGWQYGYTYSGLGLPTIIYNNKNVPTDQSFSLTTPAYEDVLIDNWLLNSPNSSAQADEVEIFTQNDWNAYGQDSSSSSKLGYITLDNTYYVVTTGYNGWPVYNFVPNVTSNSGSATPNVKDFVNALCYDYGKIQNNLYLGGTQIGVEVYYGKGGVTFNPAAVSVN